VHALFLGLELLTNDFGVSPRAEQEMECPTVPSMFHLGRAIKTVNLLRNLDKYGRPLGVAVATDAPGTSAMQQAVDGLPEGDLAKILDMDASLETKESATEFGPTETQTLQEKLAKYPLPTQDVPALLTSHAWKRWYQYLEQIVWKKPPTPSPPHASWRTTRTSTAPEIVSSVGLPSARDAFLGTMRGALTQAVQHFPSVISGSIPLEKIDGQVPTKSWLRIGQGYWDAGNLTVESVDDIMAMRSENMHFEESGSDVAEHRSRLYPAEEFRWIHFSPDDPRLSYMTLPPPLAVIYQQLEKHLLLTPNFTLVPHQLEVYREGIESLPRAEPLDPHYLGTVIVALPTPGCKGGVVRLTNMNHITQEGGADISNIDSDLSRVFASLSQHPDEPSSSAAVPSTAVSFVAKHVPRMRGGSKQKRAPVAAHVPPGEAASQDELDIERLETEMDELDIERLETEMDENLVVSSNYESLAEVEEKEELPAAPHTGTAAYHNWSSFTWTPFGGTHIVQPQTTVNTGRGLVEVPTIVSDCEPSGLSWIAFTKNVPYCIERIESGRRVFLTYHIIEKSNANMMVQQPTAEEVQVAAECAPRIESKLNTHLVNALFSPQMRQSGVAKLVSLVAYYMNNARRGHWLSCGEDDLTTIGIALRDSYAPEVLATEHLVGADAWLYNMFKWATSPNSGIFNDPVRIALAPIAMIHQGQLTHPISLHDTRPQSPPSKHVEPVVKSSKHDTLGTGAHRWESHRREPASNLVYFLNLESWEHDGPVLSHQAYSECARFSVLPVRPLSDMERILYGSEHHSYNDQTQWNSVPMLYGQRWGDELDTWEAAPIPPTPTNKPLSSDPKTFHVVGRKTFATTALLIQKIHSFQDERL